MPIIGALPNPLANGQIIDAVPVMADLNFIINQVNSNSVPNFGAGQGATLAQLSAPTGASLIGFIQSGLGASATTVASILYRSINFADFLPVGYVIDGSVDYHTQIQAAIVAARAAKLPVSGIGGVFSLGSVGLTLTGADSILGTGTLNTQFTYSGTGAAFTASAWTGTLADFNIYETNSSASGIQIGGGSQKPTIRNLFAQISGAAAPTATGSGIFLKATGDSSFSGGLLIDNVSLYGYLYGVNFRASNPANSWTSVVMQDLWVVGNTGMSPNPSAGIYMDANTDGIGTVLFGGDIEGVDYPIYTEDGAGGGVFELDIEICAHDSRIANTFNGRIVDSNGNIHSKSVNGAGGPTWSQYLAKSGAGPTAESYYPPVFNSTGQAATGDQLATWYRNASIIEGNALDTYALKFRIGGGLSGTNGIAVHPSNHYLQLSDVTIHWDVMSPAAQSGSQIVAWVAGSVCYNYTPAVGQPKGWVCTVSGTPGTWVSMGNL